MNKELKKESLSIKTLKPPKNKAIESAITRELSNSNSKKIKGRRFSITNSLLNIKPLIAMKFHPPLKNAVITFPSLDLL